MSRFGSNQFSKGSSRSYEGFVKEMERQRRVQEFEVGNEKRLTRKNREGNNGGLTNSYIGNSAYTSRPPTGVDLALGLNGYKDSEPIPKARVPSSLKTDGFEKQTYLSDFRNKNEDDPQKWNNFRSEVQQRKLREDEERRSLTSRAHDRKIENESIEIREEKSKNIEKSLPEDWNYQVELKQREHDRDIQKSIEEAEEAKMEAEELMRLEKERESQIKNTNYVESRENLENLRHLKYMERERETEDKRKEAYGAIASIEEERLKNEEDKELAKLKAQKNQEYLLKEQIMRKNREAENAREEELHYEAALREEERQFKEDEAKTDLVLKRNEREDVKNFVGSLASIDKRRNLESEALLELFNGGDTFPKNKEKKSSYEASGLLLQIQEKQALAKKLQDNRNREKEERLEQEAKHRVMELAAKERRQKEQSVYREFLNEQMNEKKFISQRNEKNERDLNLLNEEILSNREKEVRDRMPKIMSVSTQ